MLERRARARAGPRRGRHHGRLRGPGGNRRGVGRSSVPWTATRRWERRLLVGIDLVALSLTGLLTGTVTAPVVGYAVLVLVAMHCLGANEPRFSMRVLDSLPRWLAALATPLLALVPWMTLQRPEHAALTFTSVAAVLLLGGRTVAFAVINALRRWGVSRQRALVVGAGAVGFEVASQLALRPEFGTEPVGFVDRHPPQGFPPIPYFGTADDLPDLLAGIDCLIVAFGTTREHETVPVVRTALQAGVEVYAIPRFYELGFPDRPRGMDEIWGIPVARASTLAPRRRAWVVKRGLDITLSLIALAVAAPVMALTALAVKLDHGGPVLFRQTRVGANGRPFELLKFRSIPAARSNASFGVNPDELSVIGAFVRKSSIDELPQLWNILRGDMSLIGPRPERVEYVEAFSKEIPGYEHRHRLPVGLTGWAQVNGLRGGDTSIVERARFDNVYIERWSLWLDFTIVLRTVTAVLRDLGRWKR